MKINDLDFNSHYVAHQLGKFISEVDKMSLSEYNDWLEYFSIINGTKKEEKNTEANEEALVSFLRRRKD